MSKIIKDTKLKTVLVIALTLIMTVGVVKAIDINLSVGELKSLMGQSVETTFGGSTSDDWNVRGDLAITGDTTLAGDLALTGAADIGRLTQGGITLATSTAGSATTLLTSDIITYSGLDMTPGNNAITITTEATSTMTSLIPNVGDCIDFRIRNLDSVSATSTTIAAGTGVDLVENENGDVVIEGGNEAQLKFCRELDTDVTLYVDEYIAAD